MYFEQVVITAVSRSEDWWKLLATGRPGFRGTCVVLRDERTTRPATATRVSEVTPLCLFLSHGAGKLSRPPALGSSIIIYDGQARAHMHTRRQMIHEREGTQEAARSG